LSFTIQPGESVGFLGPNGAGTSTTLKMIAGCLSPDAGSIQLSGIDVQKDEVAYKKKMGYLPESNPLYEDLFVVEYLNFLANVHAIPSPFKRIQEVIAQTGLQSMQHKKIGFLSKGFKQRVGIAAAILHQPELILLDEPTSSLDVSVQYQVLELLADLQRKHGIAYLFISHDLAVIRAMAHRVIVMKDGLVVESGKTSDVLNSPKEAYTQKLLAAANFKLSEPESAAATVTVAAAAD
jgi:ABC-2 type transport system ATP-binding protein